MCICWHSLEHLEQPNELRVRTRCNSTMEAFGNKVSEVIELLPGFERCRATDAEGKDVNLIETLSLVQFFCHVFGVFSNVVVTVCQYHEFFRTESSHIMAGAENVVTDVLESRTYCGVPVCVVCCQDAVDYVLATVVVCCRVGQVEHGDGRRCKRHHGHSDLWSTTCEVIANVFGQRGYVPDGLVEHCAANAVRGIDKNGEVGAAGVIVTVLILSFCSCGECCR